MFLNMIQFPFFLTETSRSQLSAPNLPPIPPTKILVATDLSSRSDRALDRATQLARQWDAQLLVVHAIDQKTVGLLDAGFIPSWRQSTDPSVAIRDRIRRDLREEVKQLKF